MKRLIALIFLATPLFAVNTCTTPSVDYVTHSSARVQTTCNFVSTDIRINYGTTGAYGLVQSLYNRSNAITNDWVGYNLAGLAASTLYHVQVQSSPDYGTSWVYTSDQTFTTSALPNPHPALPIAPLTWTPAFPAGGGTTYTYGTNCGTGGNDFQNCLDLATYGDTIILPAGVGNTITPTVLDHFHLRTAPDATAISSITTATGTFSCSGACGLANNQPIRMQGAFGTPNPIEVGATYCAITSGAGATSFQVYRSTWVSTADPYDCTNGSPTPIVLNDSGSGTVSFLKWPVDLTKQILITTSDASYLPPVGVRVDALDALFATSYASHMAYIKGALSAAGSTSTTMFQGLDPAYGVGVLAHGYYFRGIVFQGNAAIAGTAGLNTDPLGEPALWNLNAGNSNITFEQDWFHGGGYPSRMATMINYWDGSYQSILDSTLDGDFWRPHIATADAPVTYTTTSISIGANTGGFQIYQGQTCTSPAASINSISGTATGSPTNIFLYYAMDCSFHALLPTGLSGTGTNITVTTSASPAWPTVGGRTAAGMLSELVWTNGTGITGSYNGFGNNFPNYAFSDQGTEGTQGIHTSSYGPGPDLISNTHIKDAGIALFFSDDGSPAGNCSNFGAFPCAQSYTVSDVVISRNIIDMGINHLVGQGGVTLQYINRNIYENKTGQRFVIKGNQFLNDDSDVQACGPAILLNGNGGAHGAGAVGQKTANIVTDFEISGNYFQGNSCTWNIGGASPDGFHKTGNNTRIYFHDNQSSDGGYGTSIPPTVGSASGGTGTGYWGQSLNGTEDLIVDHNTVLTQNGLYPFVFRPISSLADGFKLTNNLLMVSTDNANQGVQFGGNLYDANTPDLSNQYGSTLIGNATLWTIKNNVWLGAYSNSNPSSLVDLSSGQVSTLQAAYPGTELWPAGSTFAARQATLKLITSNGTLKRFHFDSPYISGGASHATDLKSIGADTEYLITSLGIVQNAHVFSIGTTTATVGFVAPDSFACPVDVSTNGFSTWTRFSGVSGRVENVSLTGLTTGTAYQARIDCAAYWPVVSFTTR